MGYGGTGQRCLCHFMLTCTVLLMSSHSIRYPEVKLLLDHLEGTSVRLVRCNCDSTRQSFHAARKKNEYTSAVASRPPSLPLLQSYTHCTH